MNEWYSKICPRCGQNKMVIDASRGELLCQHCGLVMEENLEHSGPEWKTYDDTPNQSRVGSPMSLAMHDMGLNTVIGSSGKDAFGKQIPHDALDKIERLRMWNNRASMHSSEDRNYRLAFSELERLKDKLALPDALVQETAYVYRKAHLNRLCKGRTTTAIVTASLYAVCRKNDIPHTLSEIAKLANIDRKVLSRSYRKLVQQLNLQMPVADPIKSLIFISSKVNVKEKTKRIAFKILEEAKKNELASGKDPVGFASAALYIACQINGESKSQKDIVLSSSPTTVMTIRTRCKEIRESLNLPQ
ncbi:MAG: transcription initiation factor IIB [Thaumarchaeota archaeon]|nr:transcription initiation factor IIB [Nitrososphaerota archaeon]